MQQQDVYFLDAHGAVVGDAQVNVGLHEHAADFATALAGERDHGHLAVVRGFDGLDDVGRVAAGGDCHQYVAGLAQRVDLALEYGVEAVIVADRREYGRVGVQGDTGQGEATTLESADQFGDEMLG